MPNRSNSSDKLKNQLFFYHFERALANSNRYLIDTIYDWLFKIRLNLRFSISRIYSREHYLFQLNRNE